jgi:hypothetical protein
MPRAPTDNGRVELPLRPDDKATLSERDSLRALALLEKSAGGQRAFGVRGTGGFRVARRRAQARTLASLCEDFHIYANGPCAVP